MSTKELQDEEREVLSSIYDGDECFKQIDLNTYQYKVYFFYLKVMYSLIVNFSLVWRK